MSAKRTLSTTALSVVAAGLLDLGGGGAAAAATVCLDLGATPPALSCAGDVDTRVDDARDDLEVTVKTGVTLKPGSGRAIDLDGENPQVTNLGTIESADDEAIRIDGPRLTTDPNHYTVDNSGVIRADDDRAIRMREGSDGSRIINREGGEIHALEQAIRGDGDTLPTNIEITNRGLVRSEEGRAIQARGAGTTVFNFGILDGGEEVVEARGDFFLENRGEIFIGERLIENDQGVLVMARPGDEDGVQFAGGEVRNHGLILGTDDGVDLDEGLVHNHAGGRIVSLAPEGEGSGVDFDEIYDDGDVERANGLARIVNEGSITGPQAIGADKDAKNPVEIVNRGVLTGMFGTAIGLAPGQGDTTIEIVGGGQVFGDIVFGSGGANTLVFDSLTDGAGIFSEVSAPNGGSFDVVFRGMTLSDMLAYRLTADLLARRRGRVGELPAERARRRQLRAGGRDPQRRSVRSLSRRQRRRADPAAGGRMDAAGGPRRDRRRSAQSGLIGRA